MIHSIRRQSGATLLIVLIMLVMLTLFAVSAMNTGNINLKVVGNMQARAEASEVNNGAIDTVLSTPRFSEYPADAVPNPCGIPNRICTDINSDGVIDYTTTLKTPACIQARIIKQGELVIQGPTSEDLACTQAQQQGLFGVSGGAQSADSLCGYTVWDLTTQTIASGASITTSPINVTTSQGVGVRIPATDVASSCL